MTHSLLFLIVSIVLFLIAALAAFGLAQASVEEILGIVSLGLASFAAAHLP